MIRKRYFDFLFFLACGPLVVRLSVIGPHSAHFTLHYFPHCSAAYLIIKNFGLVFDDFYFLPDNNLNYVKNTFFCKLCEKKVLFMV